MYNSVYGREIYVGKLKNERVVKFDANSCIKSMNNDIYKIS